MFHHIPVVVSFGGRMLTTTTLMLLWSYPCRLTAVRGSAQPLCTLQAPGGQRRNQRPPGFRQGRAGKRAVAGWIQVRLARVEYFAPATRPFCPQAFCEAATYSCLGYLRFARAFVAIYAAFLHLFVFVALYSAAS